MRDERERCLDILDAISQIESQTIKGKAALEADKMLQVWVVYYIQVIGEAARNISDATKLNHPEIPWPQVISTRNYLIHEYFKIDVNEIWNVVQNDLPDLKIKIQSILQSLGGTP